MTEEIKDETYFRLKEEYLSELDRLEQENKALQVYKDNNEDFKKAWGELNEKYKNLDDLYEDLYKLKDSAEKKYNEEKLKNIKYKSILEEMKNDINHLPNEPLWQSMAKCLGKILNKIDEVLS